MESVFYFLFFPNYVYVYIYITHNRISPKQTQT